MKLFEQLYFDVRCITFMCVVRTNSLRLEHTYNIFVYSILILEMDELFIYDGMKN